MQEHWCKVKKTPMRSDQETIAIQMNQLVYPCVKVI